ncbi:hypothetical protein ALC56_11902 [Trachymyrmex septentrionalis]|uniref:Uncharacterized protein n=1 Tax=Trachymyrmex septentrionalis TaxID=34720 RepID=A0A195F0E6_9HYME|nr:hypothetical protein ALC56_11902 [Trachymyrmex septentrionalis]
MISSTMISFWRFSSSSPITTFVYIISTISIRSMSKSDKRSVNGRFWMDPLNCVIVKSMNFEEVNFDSAIHDPSIDTGAMIDPNPALDPPISSSLDLRQRDFTLTGFEESESYPNHSSDVTAPSYLILTNYFRHQYLVLLKTVFPYLKEFVSESQRFPH